MKLSTFLRTLIFTAIHLSMCESSESVHSEEINQSDNEISDNISPHSFKRLRPPQYITHLLDEFEANSASSSLRNSRSEGSKNLKYQGRSYTKPSKRLFYAWLPTEVNDLSEDSHRTTVTFQQSVPRHDFGSFTSSRIVLTLRDDVTEVELPPKTTVSMYTHWDENVLQQELIQTQPIGADKKFYSFDITEFIASCLQENLTEPYLVNISFQARASQEGAQMLDFERLFDVQVDLPTIVYFYDGFVPSEVTLTPIKVSERRKRRSMGGMMILKSTRPATQCQRREFLVSPEELYLPNIIGPKLIDLGYCSGSCQFPLHDYYYNFSMHSFLIDRFRMGHTFDVPNGFPQSSCVPITYKAISILEEIASDQYQADTVDNMSVETCGCR